MPRSYFEHNEPDTVTLPLIEWHDEEDDGIKVVEHSIPPPTLARLIAETRLPEVE